MHERQSELLGLVQALIDALEASDLPYAIGDAIALASWSEPRATKDVDLTVFTPVERLESDVFPVFEAAGLVVDVMAALADAQDRGMFVLRSNSGYRVDVFVPSIPFYDIAAKRRRRVTLAGRETYVLDAESLIVFKMLFFRPKDLLDVQQLLKVREVEDALIRDALVEVVGEEDERVRRWDVMLSHTRGT